MPLFSPKRKISDAENKLRVLLCLDALGMAALDELWPFVARLELMEYLPFCLLVDELKNDGAIAEGSHALKDVLYLSDEGQKQLSLFLSKLPPADRDRILDAAPVYRDELNHRKQVRAAYELCGPGCFGAALTIREGDVPSLFIRITTADEHLAQRAVRGFKTCAPLVLNLLFTMELTPHSHPLPAAKMQSVAIAEARSGQPALCAFGGREHAAVVQIGEGETVYTVLLLLPSDQLAWDWAQSADACGCELAHALTVLFYDAAEDDA